MNRLVKSGMTPAKAAEHIAELFEKIKAKKPHGWLIVFTGDNSPIDYMVTDKPPSQEFLRAIDNVHVVNVEKLESEVDEFFAGLEDD